MHSMNSRAGIKLSLFQNYVRKFRSITAVNSKKIRNGSGNGSLLRCTETAFTYTVAVAAAVALSRRRPASMIGWLATERNNGKIELDPISMEERLRQLFAVYGCNGTEFSYVILRNSYRTTEFYNGRTAKRQRNGGNRALRTAQLWETAETKCTFTRL